MAEKLILESSATAQWQQLLKQAEDKISCPLHEDLETYLIFTLMRFTSNAELASTPLAPAYLNAKQLGSRAQQQVLRDLGDQCLLLTGLFPQRAEKRLVKLGYYVDLGRTAYNDLSQLMTRAFAEFYQHLATSFVQLMDVLQNIRNESALMPLQAMDLWSEHSSQNAFQLLSRNGLPVPLHKSDQYQH